MEKSDKVFDVFSVRKRTRSRLYAVQMMYSAEMTETSPEVTVENFWKSIPEEDLSVVDFAEKLFYEAFSRMNQNDELMKQFISQSWSFDRVGLVEKSILRLAIYELFEGEAPVYAVMDEYVTLAKCFSDDKSASFVNGVLENIRVKFSVERGNGQGK